ncbi:MAG: DUF2946 domain-containing protein [Alphaproteobacteria bacterium]|nr:DUF2946 domain-containing protein [Alphaproteobacteria bacterium]
MAIRNMARSRVYRRRWVAIVASLALILQSLLAADLMAAVATGSGSDFRTIMICTGDGYRQITLDANNNPVAPLTNGEADDCPVCVLASSYPLSLPAALRVSFETAPCVNLSPFDLQTNAIGWASYARYGRGPPLSIRL